MLKVFLLLCLSNLFMTYAWYGHLHDRSKSLIFVIFLAWGIAFFEYCFQVPANRLGHTMLSAPQLKLLQEVITLSVFALFSCFYLKEKLSGYDYVAFALIILAVSVSLLQPK